jgi:hypothetical protein
MDGSRATNYHHVLNSAIQFEVLMSYWWFPTETRLEKSARIYMTGCTASLFRSFLVLILYPSLFWMFAECRYKYIYVKLINCALCVEISVHTWRIEKKVSCKTYVKIMFFQVGDHLVSFRSEKKILEQYLLSGHHLFFAHSFQVITH